MTHDKSECSLFRHLENTGKYMSYSAAILYDDIIADLDLRFGQKKTDC